VIDVDIRYLPEQDPEAILEQVSSLADSRVLSTFRRPPALVDRDSVFVRSLCEAAAPHASGDVMSVGRDGSSDAVSFLRAGIPAVEFGPVGDGHHGPEEWVSISSLGRYRQALTDFVMQLPAKLDELAPADAAPAPLRAVEGGRA
jgi:succinyl-diaminopimelate desuccinylase